MRYFFSKETNTLRVYSGRTINRGGFEVLTDEALPRNIAAKEIATVKYNVTITAHKVVIPETSMC